MNLIYEDLTKKIINAAIEVHKSLGPGFLESVYENALCKELADRSIKLIRQCKTDVLYKNEVVGIHKIDLIIADKVIAELKAIKGFEDIHYAQLLSYLKATVLRV